jgi:hypothetical protein
MSMHETHLCGARNSNKGDDEKRGFDMRHDCAVSCAGPRRWGDCWQTADFLGTFSKSVRAGSPCGGKVTRFGLSSQAVRMFPSPLY